MRPRSPPVSNRQSPRRRRKDAWVASWQHVCGSYSGGSDVAKESSRSSHGAKLCGNYAYSSRHRPVSCTQADSCENGPPSPAYFFLRPGRSGLCGDPDDGGRTDVCRSARPDRAKPAGGAGGASSSGASTLIIAAERVGAGDVDEGGATMRRWSPASPPSTTSSSGGSLGVVSELHLTLAPRLRASPPHTQFWVAVSGLTLLT